jgi:phosphomannomutase
VPNLVLALLVDHLATARKWPGPVVRSVATSHLIDAVAAKHGLQVLETPVGFKHIGQIMREQDILIGGEESGGLTVHRHVKEKDGVLACLLMAELKAVRKTTFGAMLKKLYKEVGEYCVGRDNFRLTEQAKEALVKRLKARPPREIAGKKVEQVVTLDGFKFLLQGKSWVMVRFSGTEPVVRLYAEAIGKAGLKKVMAAGKRMILGR